MARPSNVQTFSIRETGKLIKFPGGEHQFFEWLRSNKYLLSDNTPAQAYINGGYFLLEAAKKKIGTTRVVIPVTRVTIKGLYALQRKIRKDFPICKPCSESK
jgi:phage antirepressor YoqD-like protein